MSLFRVSRASLRLRRLHQPLSLSHSIFHPIFPSSPPISIPNPNPNPNPNHDAFDSPIKPPYTRISSSEIFRESFKFNFKFEFTDLNSRSIPGQYAFISTSSGVAEKKEGPKDNGANVASWIDLYLPEQARPYARLARLDKPIGTWLLAWPCFWYDFLISPVVPIFYWANFTCVESFCLSILILNFTFRVNLFPLIISLAFLMEKLSLK
ncbi:hypothetical protein CsSME_00042712 [Camellia sinensis var. sinensis]